MRRSGVIARVLIAAAVAAGLALASFEPTAASLVGGKRALLSTKYSKEAEAIFRAATTQPTPARKALINTTVGRLKACTVWQASDVIYALAAADSQIARLNWKNPGTFTATENGTNQAAAWLPDQGYVGNGSDNFLDTTWNPATNGVQFTLNSAHLVVVIGTAVTDTNFDAGTGGSLRVLGRSGASISGRINSGTTHTDPTVATSIGQTGLIRRDATNQYGFRDGVVGSAVAGASTAIGSATLKIGGSISATFSTRRIAWAGAGGQLSDAQTLCYHNATSAWPQ